MVGSTARHSTRMLDSALTRSWIVAVYFRIDPGHPHHVRAIIIAVGDIHRCPSGTGS